MQMLDFVQGDQSFASLSIALQLALQPDSIRDSIKSTEEFAETYMMLYFQGLDRYQAATGESKRAIGIEEALQLSTIPLEALTSDSLVSDVNRKQGALAAFDMVKERRSFAIFVRDDTAFIVIHAEDDNYILIDPHVAVCGILSRERIYRYLTYDSFWDLEVTMLVPQVIAPVVEGTTAAQGTDATKATTESFYSSPSIAAPTPNMNFYDAPVPLRSFMQSTGAQTIDLDDVMDGIVIPEVYTAPFKACVSVPATPAETPTEMDSEPTTSTPVEPVTDDQAPTTMDTL